MDNKKSIIQNYESLDKNYKYCVDKVVKKTEEVYIPVLENLNKKI